MLVAPCIYIPWKVPTSLYTVPRFCAYWFCDGGGLLRSQITQDHCICSAEAPTPSRNRQLLYSWHFVWLVMYRVRLCKPVEILSVPSGLSCERKCVSERERERERERESCSVGDMARKDYSAGCWNSDSTFRVGGGVSCIIVLVWLWENIL